MTVEEEEELYTRFRSQIEADSQLIRDLVALRRKRGMSQTDVARLLETDQAYISRFESGNTNPRMRMLREYAVAVGATIGHTVTPVPSTAGVTGA